MFLSLPFPRSGSSCAYRTSAACRWRVTCRVRSCTARLPAPSDTHRRAVDSAGKEVVKAVLCRADSDHGLIVATVDRVRLVFTTTEREGPPLPTGPADAAGRGWRVVRAAARPRGPRARASGRGATLRLALPGRAAVLGSAPRNRGAPSRGPRRTRGQIKPRPWRAGSSRRL